MSQAPQDTTGTHAATTGEDGAQPQVVAPAPLGVGAWTARASLADTVELLALVAQIEWATFLRLAATADAAPSPEQRLRLSREAAAAQARQERVLARIAQIEGGADRADELMIAFDGTFEDYEARTEPSSWWEGVLKSYVGHGVAGDFCRIVAGALDPESREIVTEVIDASVTSERAIGLLERATSDDAVLASRLALWGRRLVGEALSVVQSILTQRPAFGRLVTTTLAEQLDAADVPEDHTSWLFGQLTAEHTRRMARLGLAA